MIAEIYSAFGPNKMMQPCFSLPCSTKDNYKPRPSRKTQPEENSECVKRRHADLGPQDSRTPSPSFCFCFILY